MHIRMWDVSLHLLVCSGREGAMAAALKSALPSPRRVALLLPAAPEGPLGPKAHSVGRIRSTAAEIYCFFNI